MLRVQLENRDLMNKNAMDTIEFPSFAKGIEVDPRLGKVPLVRKTDKPGDKPILTIEAFTEVLDLSDEDDLKKYSEIKTLCKNMKGEMMNLQIEWMEDVKNFKVLVEWCSHTVRPKTTQELTYE